MDTFYDTHAHLNLPVFKNDLDQVIQRAQDAGIIRIVTVGTDQASSQRAVSLAEQYDGVFAVVGWHPSDVMEAPEDVQDSLRSLADHPKVVALGETGLDYTRLPSGSGGSPQDDSDYKQRQTELFRQHLEVGSQLGLNCVIHQRAALKDSLSVFAPFAEKVRGQFHCFSGDTATLQTILDMGSIVSFTGIATFKNAQSIRDTLSATPLGHFMLETDSPYLAPVPHRGKRCEPAYVREIAETAANVKGCSLEELSQATCATAKSFFPKLT